jgi:hypothetical protein
MSDEVDVVRCFNPDCRREIGVLVHYDGASFLKYGELLAREVHGVCIHCGAPVHWSGRDQMFEKLIGRLLKA